MGQIDLPGKLNFQTSAADLEFQDALSKIVYPQRVPTPYWYPKAPYGQALRGLGDTCLPYDFYALQTAFGVTDCGVAPYTSDPASQYACQQKNAPLLAAIAQLSPSYGTCITQSMIPGPYNPSPVSQPNPYLNPFSGPGLLYNPANPATPSSSPQYVGYTPIVTPGTLTFTNLPSFTPPPSTTATNGGGVYNPRVSFSASRQGSLLPGDTWTVQITGGQPASAVTATSTQNGASNGTNTMGVTDANGNFQLRGTIDTNSIGAWQETWYVAGQNAGSFTFNVIAPTSPTTSPTSGPTGGGYTAPTGGSAPPAGSGTAVGTSGDWIPGISNTVVAGGAGLLVLLMVMGGRR